MTNLVDQTIAELRANHDRLAALVADLGEDQLKGPSGASEWTIADVLSHLGSGAELQHHAVSRALTGNDAKADNQATWDRWDSLAPTEQATEFVASDERLVALYESLTPEQLETVVVDLGFLPAPVPVATPLAMRLHEQTLHGWDVRVGLDPAAVLSERAASLILRHYGESMSFMFGFIGHADQVAEPAQVGVGDATVVIADRVSIVGGRLEATATFEGPLEAAVRLFAGRLAPMRTPAGVQVTGNVSLDDLRRVFPGY